MRLRGTCGLLGFALLALLALAPVVPAAGVRVEKSRSLDRLRLYWVEAASASEVNLYAVPADIARGDEFDLVDSRGYVGRVRVERVEAVDPGCQKLQLRRARARYLRRGTARPGFEDAAVAIGPGPSVGERARAFLANDAKDAPRLDHTSYQLLFVDLDGDAVPDLARDSYDCNQRRGPGRHQGAVYCYDTWTRRRQGEWARTHRAMLTYCP